METWDVSLVLKKNTHTIVDIHFLLADVYLGVHNLVWWRTMKRMCMTDWLPCGACSMEQVCCFHKNVDEKSYSIKFWRWSTVEKSETLWQPKNQPSCSLFSLLIYIFSNWFVLSQSPFGRKSMLSLAKQNIAKKWTLDLMIIAAENNFFARFPFWI